MMSFKEFTENVLEAIRAKAGDAFQIKKHDVLILFRINEFRINIPLDSSPVSESRYIDIRCFLLFQNQPVDLIHDLTKPHPVGFLRSRWIPCRRSLTGRA